MFKFINNLFGKNAQLQSDNKQLFQDFDDISNDSLRIISYMQNDVQILMNLTTEMRTSIEKEIVYYDEILEYIDKLITKQEGVSH